MADAKKQSKYVSNEELFAPLQAAFDKREKKKADERAEKDREQTKKMRKPDMDENWFLDRARRMASTPVDEEAGMFNSANNSAKQERRYGKKTFEIEVPNEVKDYEAYKDAGFKKGGKVSSASKRADGCAIRGKTRA
jgi:general stress protein YciG